MKSKKSKCLNKVLFGILFLVLCWIVYALIVQPSNDRNWERGQAFMASAKISSDLVTLNNIRNQSYDTNGPLDLSYYNQTFNISELTAMHMIEVDFSPIHAIAHTFFTFTFRNASTISVSVESRREVGEDYTPTKGMFRTYELIYIWGSETDNIARRIIWQKDPTSMYPIRIDNATLQALFLRLVVDTNDLVEHPRFYNSLFSTCTSNLLDAARGVSKKRLPWTVARFLPGYSAGYLHKNNLIITNVTEDLLAGHFRINNATTSSFTFSQDIRAYLASK